MKYIFLLFLLVIGTIEIGFRVIRNNGWLGNDFGDVFSQDLMNEGGFLIPNQDVNVVNGYGSKVPWITNSKGFRNDREFSYQKPKGVIRVLSIGDSFTAGYRVGQNETYSYILENQLNKNQDSVKYEVMVASILNPVNGLEYLNKHGLKYKPDIVLLGITLGNDLSECFINLHEYGKKQLIGSEVLENKSFDKSFLETQVFNETLPPDTYIQSSEFWDYYDRLISPKLFKSIFNRTYTGESIFAIKGKRPPYVHDFTHGMGAFLKKQPETIKVSFDRMHRIMKALKELSLKEGFDLTVSLFPQRFQVNQLDLEKTIKDYNLNPERFNWESPNDIIGAFCKELNITLVDPLEKFQSQSELLYLPGGDMHWNAKGHKLMSEQLLYGLKKQSW